MKRYFIFISILNLGTVFGQTESHLWDIFAVNPDTAFACSNTGSFYRTRNGGATWEINENLLGIGRAISSIHFPDEEHGWMTSSYGGYIFKTNDCGSSWEVHTLSDNNDLHLYEILFLDSLRGWVGGSEIIREGLAVYDRALLWATVDGGNTWTTQNVNQLFLGRGTFYRSIFFTNDNIGWLGIRYNDFWGTLFKSIDEGVTWNDQNIPNVNGVEKIFFLDNKNGWAVSNKFSKGIETWFTQLMYTVDGGETWKLQKDDFENPINDIIFLNDSIGFAIHRFHRDISPQPAHILVTSDGGYSWRIHSSYNDRLGAIHFVDEDIGWIVGENSLILKTEDGGLNWEKQDNFNDNNINDNSLPHKLELLQNYPNPFNSSTIIKYSISEPSMVSLIIYDLLGREVQTLVNQFQQTDRYSIVFNGDKISSGLYFYTLTVDNKYSFSKKMLLIR